MVDDERGQTLAFLRIKPQQFFVYTLDVLDNTLLAICRMAWRVRYQVGDAPVCLNIVVKENLILSP
jgi:hypothetical protein